jgi:hypothetical protein
MDVVRWLREAGLAVAQRPVDGGGKTKSDAVLDVSVGDRSARFVVEHRQRAPYPGELAMMTPRLGTLAGLGEPLLVVPFISPSLGESLTEAGWSWADAQGNFDLRAPGLVLRQRRTLAGPTSKQRSLPRGSGSFSVVRALIGLRNLKGEGSTGVAGRAGVSQPRASQVLSQLRELDLVERTRDGAWRPDREGLLDRFQAEYPGPGGSAENFLSLDEPADVARHAATSHGQRQLAVSADVGPDLISPWRRPSTVVIYARQGIEAPGLDLVRASGEHDANVIVRVPRDLSVFPVRPLSAEVRGTEIPLADPVQMIWDLENLGGTDRMETAEKLRRWLLTDP